MTEHKTDVSGRGGRTGDLEKDGAPEDSPFHIDLSVAVRSSIVGLFLLAVLYTIYFTRPVLLPVLVALLLTLVLAPVVNACESFGIPRWLGAAVTVGVVVTALSFGVYQVAGPATDWIADLPQLLTQARDKLEGMVSPVEEVTEAANQMQEITGADDEPAQVVSVEQPTFGERVLAAGRAFLGRAVFVLALVYFLLASGELFLLKLVRVLPNLTERKRGLTVALTLRKHLSHYFLTITIINVMLGVAVGLAMWMLDMPTPAVWGAMAALFNFIPYLGAAAGVAIVALVGFATFDSSLAAAAPALIYMGLTALEGTFVTPAMLGRTMRLNPVAILLSLILWSWMWGVPGMLIAVPTLAAVKVFADAYPGLGVMSEFLGR